MISVVSTVFNDDNGIKSFLKSMTCQSLYPAEIVITDAGSNDGTWERLLEAQRNFCIPLIAIQEKGCNVARGRNMAIDRSKGDIIVSTDIGCEWENHWLEDLVTPLQRQSGIDLVIGSWAVRTRDISSNWGLVEWSIKGDQELTATSESYSSSRSIAYRREVWIGLGGYPEDLSFAGDDALFHFLIEAAGIPRDGAPATACYWHRHSSLSAFLKEQMRYGLGDGEAAIRGKDFLLTGLRILFEMTTLIGGIFLVLILRLPVSLAGWFLIAAGLISIGCRIQKLTPAVGKLRDKGVDYAFLRIVYFIYSCKFVWLSSYLKGYVRGFFHCREARKRLRRMSPEAYREKLKQDSSRTF